MGCHPEVRRTEGPAPISLRFHDKTELRFDIEPGFTLYADYADWKTGNHRPMKRWPPVRSRIFRD
jgi:hypothetical protein